MKAFILFLYLALLTATGWAQSINTNDVFQAIDVEKNYIKSGNAEQLYPGWTAYLDAAGTQPVDCTGGTGSIGVARTSTNPMKDKYHWKWLKTGSNFQGSGWSYAFTIDRNDQNKKFAISIPVQLTTGTFAGSVDPATPSDVTVWIYDVTNATMIKPDNSNIQPLLSGVNGPDFLTTFTAASNSRSYRLCIHQSTTTTAAGELGFDNIVVGKLKSQVVIPRASTRTVLTSGTSQTYTTPAGVSHLVVRMVGGGGGGGGVNAAGGAGNQTSFGSLTANGGSAGNANGVGGAAGAGATAGSNCDVNLAGGAGAPGGSSVAGNNAVGGHGGSSVYGGGGAAGYTGAPNAAGGAGSANTGGGGGGASAGSSTFGGGGGGSGGYCLKTISSPSATYIYNIGTGGAGGGATATGGDGGSGLIIVDEFYYGANVIMNPAANLGPIKWSVRTSSTAGSTTVPFVYSVEESDPYNMYSTVDGRVTIQIDGEYVFGATCYVNASSDCKVYKNGAVVFNSTPMTASTVAQVVGQLPLVKGDIIDIRPGSSQTASSANVEHNRFWGFMVAGPGQIAVTNGPGKHEIYVHTSNSTGATATKIRRWTTVVTNSGSSISYADSSTNGGVFTINDFGKYTVGVCENASGAFGYALGINTGGAGTTNSFSLTTSQRLMGAVTAAANNPTCFTYSGWLNAGDTLRMHTDGTSDAGTPERSTFRIVRDQ